MVKISIKTSTKKQVLDITDQINEEISKQDLKNGIVNLFITHTTAAITCADLDPGTDQDYLHAFAHLVPNLNYQHPHNPQHMSDHILSSLIGTSLNIPVENGQLVLGTWQKIVLLEFDGPKERTVILNLLQSI